MKTENTPTYKKGALVALRFIESPSGNGTYVMQKADGTLHGATWRPRKDHSMQLPKAMTVFAEIAGRRGDNLIVETPYLLGRCHLVLSRAELAACDMNTTNA
ncbi:MAG: hypothetical protein IJ943_09325 [Akkermansia sp.]|nr:hypothetical protein [Akkermansia sp.]